LKTFLTTRRFHLLLLLVWIAIGGLLRFTQLTGKPPWTDEFATMVFSLGNSYQGVPLDRAISLGELLQPLQVNPTTGVSAVIQRLFAEDHHPPLYFVLAHWWMRLFPPDGEYISLGAARSLPALFGVMAIPASYALGWLAFRSRLVAQLAAALMAVSPYGIFLAQEARHYSLAALWVTASLCCFAVAVRHLQRGTPLPIGVGICWIVANSLGIATHYFFSLTLIAEAIALLGFWLKRRTPQGEVTGERRHLFFPPPWRRIGVVAAGTFVGGLVWLPVWQATYKAETTQWLTAGDRTFLSAINPIFQSLATWITMLSLLPVESPSLPVVIISGAIMLAFFIWVIPRLYRGIKVQLETPETGLATGMLGGFVLAAISLFFGITYFLGIDLTRGARYNFVYFPAVMVLLAAALAVCWRRQLSQDSTGKTSRFGVSGKSAVAIVWLMGLLSGITVVSNLGYQKYYRPDLLVPAMQQTSAAPIVIATTHNSLVQTGEMMGLAWEFRKISAIAPQFLLAHQEQVQCEGTDCRASATLQQTLAQLPRPLDLWLVNFKAPVERDLPNCYAEEDSQYDSWVDGYSARLYRCLTDDSETAQQVEAD
jgi:uncharacterized membrane protein